MKYITVSELKKNLSNLDLSVPVCATQNGHPRYVIEDYEAHKRQEELLDRLKKQFV